MKSRNNPHLPRAKSLWVRFSLTCLSFWPVVLILWLGFLCLGIDTYTRSIAREGFPSINTPVVYVGGSYLQDSVQGVSEHLATPLFEAFNEMEEVRYVYSVGDRNSVANWIYFEDSVSNQEALSTVEQVLASYRPTLPAEAKIESNLVNDVLFLGQYDLLLSVYAKSDQVSMEALTSTADRVAQQLQAKDKILSAQSIPLEISDPVSGVKRQVAFNQIAVNVQDNLQFYDAIHVGVKRQSDVDILQLSEFMEEELINLDLGDLSQDVEVVVIEDRAHSVNRNLNRLENNLIGGLVIIGLLASLLISARAALIMVVFMFSVLGLTVLGLQTIGYSLNIVTMFALILALGLIVDDAVIVVEALDVLKTGKAKAKEMISKALSKILLASLAGSVTTILVFLPLAFVSGFLGEMIRFVPVTMALTLSISFLLSVTLIPILAKWSILDTAKRQPLFKNPLLKLERRLAKFLAGLPLLLEKKPAVGKRVMLLSVAFSLSFIGFSFALFSHLNINVFPPLQDSQELSYSVEFPAGFSLEQAQAVADQINKVTADVLGSEIERVNYTTNIPANEQGLFIGVDLLPLEQRSDYSTHLIDELQAALDQTIQIPGVNIFVAQAGIGPPPLQYAFSLAIDAQNEEQARALGQEIDFFVRENLSLLTMPDGLPASVKNVRVTPKEGRLLYLDGEPILNFEMQYENAHIVNETIVRQTADLIYGQFTHQYLASQGYSPDILSKEIPATSFEDSFKSLIYVFPLALVLIYLALWRQFKTWFAPFLILLALPFACVGAANWLFWSGSSFGFMPGVGLISLLGIAVNNTILLVSYALKSQRERGLPATEAISQALQERFRPLVITTLTTALALLPLAMNDFFWKDLAWTIIWGLLVSTVLVLLFFPYCYIGSINLLQRCGIIKLLKTKTLK